MINKMILSSVSLFIFSFASFAMDNIPKIVLAAQSSEKRLEVLTQAILEGALLKKDRDKIKTLISSISQCDRIAVLEMALHFDERYLKVNLPIYIHTILDAAKKDIKDDKNLIDKAWPILQGTSKLSVNFNLINAIGKLTKEERIDVLDRALPIIESSNDPDSHDAARLIASIQEIAREDRADVLSWSLPFVNKLRRLSQRTEIVRIISLMPRGWRNEASCQKIVGLIWNIGDAKRRYEIAGIIEAVVREDRADVLDRALPFIEVGGDVEIIKAIGKITKTDRADAIEKAEPLIKAGCDRASSIKVIGSINKNDRVDFVKKTLPLTENLTKNPGTGDGPTSIIRVLGRIAKDDLDDVIEKSFPLIKSNSSGTKRAVLIEAIAEIARNDRENVVKNASVFINDISNAFKRDDFIRIIGLIRPEHRNEVICQAVAIIIEASQQPFPDERISRAIAWIGEKQRAAAILLLLDLKNTTDRQVFEKVTSSPANCLSYLMQNNLAIKQSVFDNWTKLLGSPDQRIAQKISSFILIYQDSLGLNEEDPIIQEALRVRMLLETSDDPLNPYNFFRRLGDLREQPVNLEAISLPKEIIEGLTVRLNPEYLKKLSGIAVTFRDLPVYSKDFFIKMKYQIDSRINDQLRIENYEDLMSGSLGSDYLNNLLNVQGQADDAVPVTASKLIAVVAYIESLNDVGSASAFSEREHQFIMMLSSIQSCVTGKSGGIDDCYDRLPGTAKYKTISKSKAHAFLEDVIRREVEKMLSGTNHFFNDLTGGIPNEEISQAIHQARYVENLIGNNIGINRPLYFDNHTQLLNLKLISHSKEQVIRTFYKHFPPHVLVYETIKAVKLGLMIPKNTLFETLSELMDKEATKKAWGFGENYSFFLTEFGALHLLLKLGVLIADAG